MGPQEIVDTLAALTKAVARVEGRVEELADAAEAAADRAEKAATRAADTADGITGAARAALTKVTSLQAEVQTVDRATRALDAARDRLVEVPVPGVEVADRLGRGGRRAGDRIEAAVWPALGPWLTPSPVPAAAAPAGQVRQAREPERPRGRDQSPKRRE